MKLICVMVLAMPPGGYAVIRGLGQAGDGAGTPGRFSTQEGFENPEVVQINTTLLESLGASWLSPAPLPDDWMASEAAEWARARIRELVGSELAGSRQWAIFDPRLCRVAPLWVAVLREFDVDLIAILDPGTPSQVASALEQRHGISPRTGITLWMRALVDSECATRGLPRIMLDCGGGLGAVALRAVLVDWPGMSWSREEVCRATVDWMSKDEQERLAPSSLEPFPPIVRQLSDACSAIANDNDDLAWGKLAVLAGESQAALQMLTYVHGERGDMAKDNGETFADLHRRIDELCAEQKAISARQGPSQRETDRLTALQRAQARELAEIHASTLWRVLFHLRTLLGAIPSGVRRQLRRALKAVWWTMTPWRLPARLRHLRQHHSAPGAVHSPGGAASIGYEPAPAGGRYVLTEGLRAYTYIPPRRPADWELRLVGMKRRPRFSMVVPVYNTPPGLLGKLVESVIGQWYPDWELILVNDNSTDERVKADLDQIADPRIVVLHLGENKRISLATNEGIARATGDYIVFADHDDELTVDCLFELALCVERDDPDFIYSDEDKIDESGQYVEPFFKPDWSPDTLMSTMYTCHVSCVRRELVNALGGLRPEYDGAQDWDFILRVVEKTRRIAHIPKVLYHWRIIPASVASDLNAKPYAITAGKKARVAAMERRGAEGEMEPVNELPGYYRAVYRLRGNPKISIIIPSKNNYRILKQCIDSIESKTTYGNVEIVVIDNGSSDRDTVRYVDNLRVNDRFRVLSYDKPFNYSAINNLGAFAASGDLLLFLNDDTEVLVPDWLERLGGYAQLPHVGAVGAKLLYPGAERVQHVGVVNLAGGPGHAFLGIGASEGGYFARALLEYNWLAVTGACLMVERTKFEQVGRFDESLPVAYNDVDLCFRIAKAGFYNLVSTGVTLIHHESYSRGSDDVDPIKQKRLKREMQMLYLKHPGLYQYDPFHSPNLASRDVWFRLPQ